MRLVARCLVASILSCRWRPFAFCSCCPCCAWLQVESLQAQLYMARSECNSASQSLEDAKAEAAALEDTLGAVQAQRREVLQAKAAAEAQVAQLTAEAEELRASLSATAAQVRTVAGVASEAGMFGTCFYS